MLPLGRKNLRAGSIVVDPVEVRDFGAGGDLQVEVRRRAAG